MAKWQHLDLQDQMFRPAGPLGDFGNKINLAYLMGFISKDAWKELDTIRYIRNRFAHSVGINRWNIDWLKSRCNNLVLWEKLKIKIRRSDRDDPKELALTLGPTIEEDEQEFPMIDMIEVINPLLANERYVAACKFYVAAFSIVIHLKYQIQNPLF